MRKGKDQEPDPDPDPYPSLMDLDPGGLKNAGPNPVLDPDPQHLLPSQGILLLLLIQLSFIVRYCSDPQQATIVGVELYQDQRNRDECA
jgi:hypothetical protein